MRVEVCKCLKILAVDTNDHMHGLHTERHNKVIITSFPIELVLKIGNWKFENENEMVKS